MLQKDVKIGETYLTRIGESLARVIVTGEIPGGTQYFHTRTRYRVRRENESQNLPKARTASALRPVPESEAS